MPIKARKWVIASRPASAAIADNLQLEEFDLPEPSAQELLIEPLYLRAAPHMLKQMISGGADGEPSPLGSTVLGAGVGRVMASNHLGFQSGDLVLGGLPWQDHVVSNATTVAPVEKLEPMEGVPITAPLHVLGGPGRTAYFGFHGYAQAKVGDTLVVSTAAGAVGAVVCQLGKLQGCRVVGITGTKKKCDWLIDEAGIDEAINYRETSVHEALKASCPNGIDIYFDNVGGETLDAVLDLITVGARIVLCGASSQYNNEVKDWEGPKNYFNLVYRQAQMHGFYIFNFEQQFAEASRRLASLVSEGKLKFAEDIVEGFDNATVAFERVLNSENLGTQLIRVSESVAHP